jgi:hypothetical protein
MSLLFLKNPLMAPSNFNLRRLLPTEIPNRMCAVEFQITHDMEQLSYELYVPLLW